MEPIHLKSGVTVIVENRSATEESRLPVNDIGKHAGCGGTLNRWPASIPDETITCDHCEKSTIVPKGIDTYGRLRQLCDKRH
jgi:hypothetical protein